MAGISSKAAGKLENKFKYNGIEHNTDFDLNMYDAFYRNLDPQIGRFWQIDPEAESLEEFSPYESMYNNPICVVDPLGDFGSWIGAFLHKVFNGGGRIGENQYGEWYVNKSRTEGNSDGSVTVIGTHYYGKGRNQYSNATEGIVSEDKIQSDIWMKDEKSMYRNYDSPKEVGNAALSYTGALLPNPIIRSGTITINASQAANAAKNTIQKLLNAANALDKNGLTAVGRALQKHGSRVGSSFPKATGNPTAINSQGEMFLKEIITNPSVTTATRHHARFGNILEYKLPSGQGARFSGDGSKFIGFIEP
jgi:RHS repeat-associated protein